MGKINTAIHIKDIAVTDPDTNNEVTISIFKHENSGGMFGIDSSFIEDNFEADEKPTIADPFNNNAIVELSY